MPPLRQGKLLAAALLAGSAFSGAAVAQAPGQAGLNKVASFQHQVTGVNVNGDGRIFLNFPRWTEDSKSRSAS